MPRNARNRQSLPHKQLTPKFEASHNATNCHKTTKIFAKCYTKCYTTWFSEFNQLSLVIYLSLRTLDRIFNLRPISNITPNFAPFSISITTYSRVRTWAEYLNIQVYRAVSVTVWLYLSRYVTTSTSFRDRQYHQKAPRLAISRSCG